MKKKRTQRKQNREMLAEYDFRDGARGKYADRFAAGTNLVTLAPDVAKAFPDARAVNTALRALSSLLSAVGAPARALHRRQSSPRGSSSVISRRKP